MDDVVVSNHLPQKKMFNTKQTTINAQVIEFAKCLFIPFFQDRFALLPWPFTFSLFVHCLFAI
jgi:hypothetical protein